jgi:hypothetical protein
VSATETITGADALQALIDTKAKLNRLTEWRSNLTVVQMGAERARVSLEAKERELLVIIGRRAADEPQSFGERIGVSASAERWIDEHDQVIKDLLTTSTEVLTSAGFSPDASEVNSNGR